MKLVGGQDQVDMDPLWLVARLGPMVAGCGVVSGEARNSVYDTIFIIVTS